jgi:two-component system phosphate regulon sensor histidine kinase PhoR
MAYRSTLRIALLIAVASSAVTALLLDLFLPQEALGGPLPIIGITGLIVFIASFGSAYFLVKRFVQERVDLIHRTMNNARGGRAETVKRASDDLRAVDAEVNEWADEKRSEISDLRERERFRREFIGNLAHELRTPIFSIQGYILTLLEGGLEDPKVNRDFLQRAGNGTERMIRIVEDLDLITQLESGVIGIAAKRMDLKKLVDEMIDDLRIRAADRQVALRNGIGEELWVKADRDRLAQVFANLFNNAIHYGHTGGSCTVRAFDIGEQVLVEVADDGPGIPAEHLPRLFERFYRVGKSRARNEGGSGLGLSIVKHIVEGHHGTISVKSIEGQGTTFTLTLPKAH